MDGAPPKSEKKPNPTENGKSSAENHPTSDKIEENRKAIHIDIKDIFDNIIYIYSEDPNFNEAKIEEERKKYIKHLDDFIASNYQNYLKFDSDEIRKDLQKELNDYIVNPNGETITQ